MDHYKKFFEYMQKYSMGSTWGEIDVTEINNHIDWLEGFLENEYPVEGCSIVDMIRFVIRLYSGYGNILSAGLVYAARAVQLDQIEKFPEEDLKKIEEDFNKFLGLAHLTPYEQILNPEDAADFVKETIRARGLLNTAEEEANK